MSSDKLSRLKDPVISLTRQSVQAHSQRVIVRHLCRFLTPLLLGAQPLLTLYSFTMATERDLEPVIQASSPRNKGHGSWRRLDPVTPTDWRKSATVWLPRTSGGTTHQMQKSILTWVCYNWAPGVTITFGQTLARPGRPHCRACTRTEFNSISL